MDKKIKICHIIGDFVNGGVESVIYNYFTHMNLEKFDVHIIGHDIKVQECADRFKELGFTIHIITPKSVSFTKSLKEMQAIFKKYKFDIIHSHLTEWACVPMFLGWKCGIKVRVNHSHMAEKPAGIINKIYYGVRLFLGKMFATDLFACGRDAGIYLFGEKNVENGKVTILPNAIDFEKFAYDVEKRKKIRTEQLIDDDTIVIGHVGRFFEQKNHNFLIDIFEAYHKINKDSILILLGDGKLFNSIKEKVENLGLADFVRFLGVRSDVGDWYQAMDIFILPSLFEGFPVVGVEAQAAGLPCIFSTAITSEIAISDNTEFMDLSTDVEMWAQKLNNLAVIKNRNNAIIDRDRYDINKTASWLCKFYENKM